MDLKVCLVDVEGRVRPFVADVEGRRYFLIVPMYLPYCT